MRSPWVKDLKRRLRRVSGRLVVFFQENFSKIEAHFMEGALQMLETPILGSFMKESVGSLDSVSCKSKLNFSKLL